MLDPPAAYQSTLSIWYRGPEWAFAIREGDLDALAWVLERVNFWNGGNSLIIPVRSDGRTWGVINHLLDVHPVEACFVHESVSEKAADRLAKNLGTGVRQWSTAWDGFDEHELHPLLLQPDVPAATRAPELRVPRFSSKRLQRISLAAWGHLREEDHSEYEARFDIQEASGGVEAHAALLEGQLNQRSPIEQSTRLIEHYGPLPIGRSLYVFTRGSFAELVEFWNLRSRTRDSGHRQLLIGVTKEAFEQPAALAALPDYILSDEFFSQEPDIGAMAYKDAGLVRAALTELGFEERLGNQVSRSIGRGRGGRGLSFGFFGPHLPGPIKRGAVVSDQITVTSRRASFRPQRPPDLPQTGHHIRVALEGLSLPMPLTGPGAGALIQNAYPSREGVTIETNAWIGNGYLNLEIPNAQTALAHWASTNGESAQLSAAGRYGQALLDRLGALDGLDALADEKAVAILTALAPTSRKKLAQRVVAEAKQQTGQDFDEKLLADLLGERAEYLELQARLASEIAGEAGTSKKAMLPTLAALVGAGFVVRGAGVRCPTCGYRQVVLLEEQKERLRCQACHAEFLLPVLDEGQQHERPSVYRLDGLMGRAMDQDLLPVLLALRALLKNSGPPRAVWPGLEFTGGENPSEQDLLISNGQEVWVAECKLSAEGLPDGQLHGLLQFAELHEATPVVAALTGSFSETQRTKVLGREGLVLERGDLLG
jgi:DNA-binding MarR family transcriptional regulator